MSITVIDRLYEENRQLIAHLESKNEISLRLNVEDAFRKTLLLSAASFFEHQVHECMLNYVTERTKFDKTIIALVKAKAIDRQYHTYFQWDTSSANSFFALFGDEFRDRMKTYVKNDTILQASIRDFLQLGSLRNQLVHQDFATFPLDKTADEIFALYKSGLGFIEVLPMKLRELSS